MHVIYSYVLCIAKEWPDIDFFLPELVQSKISAT